MDVLFCVPYAGAGSSIYTSWARFFHADVKVIPLRLKGREDRFSESPYESIAEVVHDLLPTIVRALGRGSQITFFGHSVGALIAYELSAHLYMNGHDACKIIVSGSGAPNALRKKFDLTLSDDALLASIEQQVAFVHPSLRDPELRDILMPTLRADILMHNRYLGTRHSIKLPIRTIRGSRDILVSAADMSGWCDFSTDGLLGDCQVEGGHMYMIENEPSTLTAVNALLKSF